VTERFEIAVSLDGELYLVEAYDAGGAYLGSRDFDKLTDVPRGARFLVRDLTGLGLHEIVLVWDYSEFRWDV
jgi:hypothetical protein